MATEFSRLYRELCHVDPHASNTDVKYLRERKSVLKTLGYEVDVTEPLLAVPLKFHGKAARRRAKEIHLNAVSVEASKETKYKREMKSLSVKTQQINELTTKIQGLMSENKYVSPHLWSKYDKIYGAISENKHNSNAPSSPTRQITKTIPRPAAIIRRDFSKHKWTKAEREKMNELYLHLLKPLASTLGAWDVYFDQFSSKFQLFFPQHSKEDIIDQIKTQFSLRQFKERGEEKYWEGVRATSPCRMKLPAVK